MSKSENHNAKHVGDAIRELLHHYHLQSKFDEANLIASWERLLGKPVAKHTKKVFIRNKVLFVELDSASLKK
jgi:predicted nucleic acid-binding Zn ribbon protein